jgi:hypothetical protein
MKTLFTRRNLLGAMTLAWALNAPAAVDPLLLNLLPPDAALVSGVAVQQAKNTAFGRFVLSQMSTDDEEMRKFIEMTGFDPRRDLNEIVIATVNTGGKTRALVAARGAFAPGRILAAARTHGAAVQTYNGVELALSPGNDPVAIGLVDAGLALAGDPDVVKAALDRRARPTSLPAATVARIQNLSATQDAWFYSFTALSEFAGAKFKDPNVGGMMENGLLASVLQAGAGVKFTSNEARVTAEATTRTDRDATALADVFRFVATLLTQNANGKDVSALQQMQVTTQANVMRMQLSIPESTLESWFAPRRQQARK